VILTFLHASGDYSLESDSISLDPLTALAPIRLRGHRASISSLWRISPLSSAGEETSCEQTCSAVGAASSHSWSAWACLSSCLLWWWLRCSFTSIS